MKKTDINITLIKEKSLWQKTLSEVSCYDFYHTFDYHELSKLKNESSVLIKYIEGDIIICLPLLIRPIEGTTFYDATSVYGYAGPLKNKRDTNLDNTNFKKHLNEFLIKENIISVFSRLHPFIDKQEDILENIGTIKTLGNVVYLDLKEAKETQESAFSKTAKRYLKKAQKTLIVKKSNNLEALESFIDLYYKNMDRLNAHKNYYFSKEYFLSFINSNEFETDIVYAVDKETNKTISAALIIRTNEIIQYHLSGTDEDYLRLSPLRALINKVRLDYSGANYSYFNLGGGLENKQDSLFDFKSSLSKSYKPFKIWTYIVNEDVYNTLVSNKNFSKDIISDFFPKYRWEEKNTI
ncbi:GNAT family N-acetyltransferase [Algibacter sp. AS12]|uniref:GNAT family N-acetyltransferase n=1 Tax=Algibacter sp. AS12 TaxID=3135773 RepID=UPI00398B305F